MSNISPTTCPVCGCTVVHHHLMEVSHKVEVYFNGTLRDTYVKGHYSASGTEGEWRCSACNHVWDTASKAVIAQDIVPSHKLTLCVEKDTNPVSPRISTNNISFIYLLRQPRSHFDSVTSYFGDKHDYRLEDFHNWEAFRKTLMMHENALYARPLYYCDDQHAFNNKCLLTCIPFEFPLLSIRVGYMFTTSERVEKQHITAHDIEATMFEELIQYNHFLIGNVWRWSIYDENNKKLEWAGNFYSEADAREAGEKAMEGI